MSLTYRPPRPLEADDPTAEFVCRSQEQTAWLVDHALQAHLAGTTKVFVATSSVGDIAGYFAWGMASVHVDDAPRRMTKGAGRYPQPVALLARLGVDQRHERRGIGAALVRDVILRVADLGSQIGCRGLLVHTESDEARSFYLHLVPEFMPSPTDHSHLVLLMKDIHRTLRA